MTSSAGWLQQSLQTLEQLARQPLGIERERIEVPEYTGAERSDVLVWRDSAQRIAAICRSAEGAPEVALPGLGTIRAFGSPPVLRAALAPSRTVASLREAHRRFALPMMLQAFGAELLHASAIRSRSGVIAFCGESGAGKSTTAQLMVRRGHGAWSDDALALSPIGGWQSVGLPFRARLRPDAAQALGIRIIPRVTPPAGIAPLAAIYILSQLGRVSRGGVAITRFTSSGAFKAILPHASCFSLADPGRNLLMIDRYLDLASRVPMFRVAFRANSASWVSVPDAIQSHLASLGLTASDSPESGIRGGATSAGPFASRPRAAGAEA